MKNILFKLKDNYQMFGLLSLVVVIGFVIVSIVNNTGQDVSKKMAVLVGDYIPQLDTVYALHQNITELDLTLYRYYETSDSDLFTRTWANNQRDAHELVSHLNQPSFDHKQVKYYLSELQRVAKKFDLEIQKRGTDWDLLRLYLAEFRQISEQFDVLLNTWGNQLHHDLNRHSENTQRTVSSLVQWQSAFSLLVLIIAAVLARLLIKQSSEYHLRKELALFPEQNPHPIVKLTRSGDFIYMNPAAQRLVKKIGCENNLSQLFPANFQQDGSQLFDSTVCLDTKDYPLADRMFSATFHHIEGVDAAYAYLIDVTDRAKAEADLVYRANHDILTKLPNRRRLAEALRAKTETSLAPFSVLSIKAGRLYLINASLGHDVGDKLLAEMSTRLKTMVSEQNERDLELFYFESGGWVILYNDNAVPALAKQLGDEVVHLFTTSMCVQDSELTMPCTVGVTLYPQGGSSSTELMKHADAALRQAYREGVNVRLYSEDLTEKANRWLMLEQGIKRALDNDGFTLNIQPKVHADTGHFAGGEVLVRWQRDEQWISPAEFIPVAEESGLIIALGEWVLRTACKQWVSWSEMGLHPARMAVNVSVQQFTQVGFVELVAGILNETAMPPSELELEITEEVASENPEKLINTMTELKALGVRLAIDDFGTGYSSLSYLRRFPIDTLKIDQSFVAKMEESENDAAIVRMIMGLAKELKLEVVAEGVETSSQHRALTQQGAELIQGYYFYRPMALDSYQALLNEQGK